MKRFLWPLVFCSSPLLSGCAEPPPTDTAPLPPLDLTPCSNTETATFALG
jgi:hypothetical protein